MTTLHWTDAHITCAWDDSDDKMYYTGHDEYGEPLCRYSDRSHVVAHLEAYAKNLERYNGVSFDNRPTATHINWDDAPHWANYAAIDANGSIFWYEDSPLWCSTHKQWITNTGLACYARRVAPMDPEDAAMAWYTRPTSTAPLQPLTARPGDVLHTEAGDYLVVQNYLYARLVRLSTYESMYPPASCSDDGVVIVNDFHPTVCEDDVFQVTRHGDAPPPSNPSGPFRDWNITLSVLDAINDGHFPDAISAAVLANPSRDIDHVKDFVRYLMEDN